MDVPADQVWSGRNAADLAPLLPRWPDSMVSKSQLLSSSGSVSLRGQYWNPSCSPSMPVQLLTSLQATVFTTSMLTTCSFALQCTPTTHRPGCASADARQWYMQNGLQLNPDKSEATIIGTAHQLQQPCHPSLSPTSFCR